MNLHFSKHASIVKVVADVGELSDLRDSVLLVIVFGRDEKSGAANEQVLSPIHYSP